LLAVNQAAAQQSDTIAVKAQVHKHSPRTALIMSLVIPGLGQVYNQKYWKVPIIYGAGGAFAYYIGFNQLKYQKFRNANDTYLKTKIAGRTLIDGQLYENSRLAAGRDFYRRFRDLSVLGFGVIYFLNAVDAMIDANFFYYDVTDDLSLRIRPTVINSPGLTSSLGFQFDIGF
jgi:hypothetical protein